MRFFIVHGAYGHPGENWFPWLKERLEAQGHEVFVPAFPTPENQTLEKWMAVFSQYQVDEKTIFIGHSLGVPFILSLLEKFKAKVSFLVAGFCTLPENKFKKGMRTFVKDFDYKMIRKNCKKFYVYHSNNDPYVQLSKGEELAEKVKAKFTLVEGAGHFNEKAGYSEFQKLLDDIAKDISNDYLELRQFLVKAKVRTYASAGEGGEKILEDGAKELSYEEGAFKYRDRYYGFNPFSGEEVVWKNGEFIWAMNYYGKVTSDKVPAKMVYQFLQKAMRKVTEDRPFRGPKNLKEGDFEYVDKSDGTVGCFVGIEKILYRGQEVYRLDYPGGFVRKK